MHDSLRLLPGYRGNPIFFANSIHGATTAIPQLLDDAVVRSPAPIIWQESYSYTWGKSISEEDLKDSLKISC